MEVALLEEGLLFLFLFLGFFRLFGAEFFFLRLTGRFDGGLFFLGFFLRSQEIQDFLVAIDGDAVFLQQTGGDAFAIHELAIESSVMDLMDATGRGGFFEDRDVDAEELAGLQSLIRPKVKVLGDVFLFFVDDC